MEVLQTKGYLRGLAFLVSFTGLASTAVAQYGFPMAGDTRSRDLNAGVNTQGFGWGFNGGASAIDDSRGLQSYPLAQNWTLGVAVQNTDRGVLVTRVQPGSAAQQAGLVANDVVLTVGGFQVGYVGNQLFDVGDEIRRRANGTGQVNLLVLHARTGQLELMTVGLQQNSAVVQGQVFWRDRQALPQGAVLQVRIDNATRTYVSASGDTRTFPITQQQPIPFEMYLDRQYLNPSDRYQIQAAIMYGQQVLYTMVQPVAIDPTGSQGPVQLELVNATGGSNTQYSAGYSPAASQEITQYYQQYLRRQPSQRELQAWLDHFARGRSRADLPVSLLGSTEFFESLGGNNSVFINQMFRLAASREPQQGEMNQWLQALQNNGNNRVAVVRDFYTALTRR